MALKTAFAALAAIACLASCGTRANDPLLGAVRGLAQGVFSAGNSTGDGTDIVIDPRLVLTRDLINSAATPLTFVQVASAPTGATLLRIATNREDETWQVGETTTVTLTQNGLLRATRGLGADLYGTDTGSTQAALRARAPGPVARSYVHVNGSVDSVTTPVTCQLSYAAQTSLSLFGEARRLTPVTEVCTYAPTGDTFQNQYWIDTTGFIWASDQWAGPELGHLHIERLYR